MLYAITGTDREKVLEKLDALILSFEKKYNDPGIVRIGTEELGRGVLEEYAGAQGLFNETLIVVLDELLDAEEDDIAEKFSDFKESRNIFICLQVKPKGDTRRKLEKYAEKIEAFELPKGKKDSFDIFALTDALGRRDRKNAWVLYQKARATGAEEEQLHGMVFWMVKGMLLASRAKSAKEAGLSPFVYSKASSFAKNYTEEELEKLSQSLISTYHDSRRGIEELPIALERLILSL